MKKAVVAAALIGATSFVIPAFASREIDAGPNIIRLENETGDCGAVLFPQGDGNEVDLFGTGVDIEGPHHDNISCHGSVTPDEASHFDLSQGPATFENCVPAGQGVTGCCDFTVGATQWSVHCDLTPVQ